MLLIFLFESVAQHHHIEEIEETDLFLSKKLTNLFNKEPDNILRIFEQAKTVKNIEFDLNNQDLIENKYQNFTEINTSIDQSERLDYLEGVYSIGTLFYKGERIDEVTNYMVAEKTYPHKNTNHYIIKITFFHVKDAFVIGKTEISYFNGSGINDYIIQSSISQDAYKDIKLSQQSFSIYPNPATDVVFIKGKGDNILIEVLNSSGSILQKVQKQGRKHTLNVEEFPTGLYSIRLINVVTGKEESHKFIKS